MIFHGAQVSHGLGGGVVALVALPQDEVGERLLPSEHPGVLECRDEGARLLVGALVGTESTHEIHVDMHRDSRRVRAAGEGAVEGLERHVARAQAELVAEAREETQRAKEVGEQLRGCAEAVYPRSRWKLEHRQGGAVLVLVGGRLEEGDGRRLLRLRVWALFLHRL